MARARSRKRRPTGARRASAAGDAAPNGSRASKGAAPNGSRSSKGAASNGSRGAASYGSIGAVPDGPDGASSAPNRSRGASRSRTSPTAPSYGERPHAPWHPLPLSELLILVGAIGAALGLARTSHEFSRGGALLLAGLAAVAIGTIEVTLREHRSGYRSHTVMLAALLVLLVDSLLVLVLTAFVSLPRLFSVGLIAFDIALFAFFFKLLRARFLDARHARVIRER